MLQQTEGVLKKCILYREWWDHSEIITRNKCNMILNYAWRSKGVIKKHIYIENGEIKVNSRQETNAIRP